MDRFDKFTDRARKVLTLSQDEAQRFNHNYIGTEHILLGLVRDGEGVAARVLVGLGAEFGKVRTAVESIIGRGDQPVVGEVGLTPRAKRVIELAIDEARRLGHNYIGTEHLLLGLVREGEGIAAGVLESVGVNLDKARYETIRVLSEAGAIGDPTWVSQPGPSGRRYVRFEDWTTAARAAIVAAQAAAEERRHEQIDTAHLLLGAVASPGAPAVATLALLGVDRAHIQDAVAAGLAELPPVIAPADRGLSLEAKQALTLAEAEAARLGAEAVSVVHLLIAVAQMPMTLAGGTLTTLGVTIDRLRDALGSSSDAEPADLGPDAELPEEGS